MKLFIFSILIATTVGYPAVKTWPLSELHETFNKLPEGDPLRPYLEQGAEMILGPIFEEKNLVFGHAIIPSPTGARGWTKIQLSKAADNTTASPILRLMVKRALGNIKKRVKIWNTAIVAVPAVDISTWSRSDINKYIKDPTTKPELLPYLKKAQKQIKKTKGKKKGKVTLVTPISLVPVKSGTNPYPMGYVFQKMTISDYSV